MISGAFPVEIWFPMSRLSALFWRSTFLGPQAAQMNVDTVIILVRWEVAHAQKAATGFPSRNPMLPLQINPTPS